MGKPDSIMVEDIDQVLPKPGAAAAPRARKAHVPPAAAAPVGADPDGDADENAAEGSSNVVGLAAALGREEYTWTSPWNLHQSFRFRRPPGGTREMVMRVLGPEQCDNSQLVREFMALASIFEMNGEPYRQPTTTMAFRALKQLVGYIGPNEKDWADEPISTFVFAYEAAMFPDQLEMIAELQHSGLSPQDKNRILKASGLERPKA